MMRLTANDSNEPKPHIDERKSGKQGAKGQEKGATEKEQRHGYQSQAFPIKAGSNLRGAHSQV
jgi:hypothetical protein